MELYAGIDLHSTNSFIVITDETDKQIYKKRLENDAGLILRELEPYKEQIAGVVVESTYNWYWIVDCLQENNYKVHLANTTAIQQYSGLKYTDDHTDSAWLAKLRRLKLLQEGYIYPKEERGMRELLRRRLVLVRQQTASILGIQSMLKRYENIKLTGQKIKACSKKEEEILKYAKDNCVQLALKAQLTVLSCLIDQIDFLEKKILLSVKKNDGFKLLKTIPGIGDILAMTILLETGEIKRFEGPGNYSSYCRCVGSKRISNEKKKGENNRKNGNVYLSWAFIEAANYSIQYSETIKKYYQRKLAKTKRIIALKTIANKLSKACYFILRDKVEFDMKKLFG